MTKRMLIDAAHPEETRVVVLNGNRLDEFDFETSTKKQIKGNIYLAKVTRVEPSLQAAFVEYGGNRHGFLAFSEIHPDYYRIPVADRQAALAADRAAAEREREEVEAEEDAAHDAGIAEIAAAPRMLQESSPEQVVEVLADAVDQPEEPSSDELANPVLDQPAEKPADATADVQDHQPSLVLEPAVEAPVDPTVPPTGPAADDIVVDSDAPGAAADAAGEPVGGAAAVSTLRDESGRGNGAHGQEEAQEAGEHHAADHGGAGHGGYEHDAAYSDSADRDGAYHNGHDQETNGHESADHDGGENGHNAPVEVAQDTVIETVGGDEIEEASRRRARPLRHYKIQEVIKRRQIMLVQVTKEERGNKGAALTTYLSLAGRYCVLMPNTPRGGGVSRKITSVTDRRRLKDLMSDLDVPDGMGVIVRTAGSERSKAEIKRDFEYLIRLWDEIRDVTLQSTAPALIYEEGNLIKRSIRDLYTRDLDEVIVDGDEGYKTAKAFMKMLMPSHAKRVKPYRDPSIPLFHRFQIESQIDLIHSPVVQLRSGGYIVINPTEALVAIDVNSGRSTKERNIEETALKTNLEAADEVARQLRLRDLAGLIVIDFIDMEEGRNQAAVERRLKEAMRNDRARIQLGRISPFGLLELSRQRLRPSLIEASTQPCPHCNGTGHIRSTESTALHILRAIEEEGMRRRSAEISVAVPTGVALYLLNQKRAAVQQAEARYGCSVMVTNDDTLIPPAFRLDRLRALTPAEIAALPQMVAAAPEPEEDDDGDHPSDEDETAVEADGGEDAAEAAAEHRDEDGGGRGRRRRRRRRGEERGREDSRAEEAEGGRDETAADDEKSPDAAERLPYPAEETEDREHEGLVAAGEGDAAHAVDGAADEAEGSQGDNGDSERKRRRRGRRGGRRRRRGGPNQEGTAGHDGQDAAAHDDHDGAAAEGFDAETQDHGDSAGEDEVVVASEVSAAAGDHHEPMAATALEAAETVWLHEHPHSSTAEAVEMVAPEPMDDAEDDRLPPASDLAISDTGLDIAAVPVSELADREVRAAEPVTAEVKRDTAAEPEPAAAAAPPAEDERQPVQYNIPEPHEVTGPPTNPRRGWWRR